jgi:N-acetylneuraminic acid mutarotase
MYVLGGNNGNLTASVLKFDSTEGTWSQRAPMPAARIGLAICTIGSDIYIFGGADGHNEPQATVFKYDTEANEWSTLAPMPHGCSWYNASVVGGLVYIVGFGVSGCDVDLLRFDPVSGAWSMLAQTSIGRKYGASFVLGGFMYAVGGDEGAGVERYDVASNTWAAVADMLEGRSFFGAVTIRSAEPTQEQDLFDSLIAKASCRRP